ncbi:MAG: hypothetical protein ABGX22_19535 [Pirellulaceae bacterium]|jgi:hypothetical protein
MGTQNFRIFGHSDAPTDDIRATGIEVTLGQVFPVLGDALLNDRTWLDDFRSEKILLSPDLYEILSTYERLLRRQAG